MVKTVATGRLQMARCAAPPRRPSIRGNGRGSGRSFDDSGQLPEKLRDGKPEGDDFVDFAVAGRVAMPWSFHMRYLSASSGR